MQWPSHTHCHYGDHDTCRMFLRTTKVWVNLRIHSNLITVFDVTFSLFSGRFQHNNDYIPGKALRSHKCTYVPYGGKEIPSSNYEILVSDDQSILKWIPESGGKNP